MDSPWNKLVKNLTIFLFLMHLFFNLSNIEINWKQKCTNIYLLIVTPSVPLSLIPINKTWSNKLLPTVKWDVNFNIPCHSSGNKWIVVSWMEVNQTTCSNIEISLKMIIKWPKLSISCSLRRARIRLKPASLATKMFSPTHPASLQRTLIFTIQIIST